MKNFHYLLFFELITIYCCNKPSSNTWLKCELPYLTHKAIKQHIVSMIRIWKDWVAKSGGTFMNAVLDMHFWILAKTLPPHKGLKYLNPYAAGGSFCQNKMMQRKLKNDWHTSKWVLIWEHSLRAIQCIPTWQGLDGFQRSSLSIGRVLTENGKPLIFILF